MNEPPHGYQTLDWLETRISYPIVRTSWGDLGANTWLALRGQPVPERGHYHGGDIDLPVFTETGLARRQRTGVYKVRPVKGIIRQLTGMAPPALTTTLYLGISTNETRRAKVPKGQWIKNRYP